MRVTAGLAALLFATSGGAQLLHAVEEAHVTCPEHGELIHADASGLAVVMTEAVQARAEADAEHEHCGILVTTDSDHAELDRFEQSVTLVAARNQPPAQRLIVRSVLERAPKSSPPV